MYAALDSTLSFKDNRFQSQVPTWPSTLACTSDKFHSSWRPGTNHTPRMRTGTSFQGKSPGRVTSPSCHSTTDLRFYQSDFGSLRSFCTSQPRLLHSLYVQTAVHKDSDIIGVRRDLCCKRASKRNPAQSWTCPSSLSLRSRASKARRLRKGDMKQPCRTNRSIAKAP